MKTTWVGVVVAVALAAGCSTPYQRMGFAGGYRDTEVAPGVVQIDVRGNAFTNLATLTSYFHRRAGEICAPRKYDFRLGLGATRAPSTFTATSRSTLSGTQTVVSEQQGAAKGWVTGVVMCLSAPAKAPAAVATRHATDTPAPAAPDAAVERLLALDVETGELSSASETSSPKLAESRKLAPVIGGKVVALTPEGTRVKVDATKAKAALTLGYHILSGAELAAEQRAATGSAE